LIRFIYFIWCRESENSLIYATPANPNGAKSIHPMSARKIFIPPSNSFKNSQSLHQLIAITCASTVSIKICLNRKSISIEIGKPWSAVEFSSFNSQEGSMRISCWAFCRKRRKKIGRSCWNIIKEWSKSISSQDRRRSCRSRLRRKKMKKSEEKTNS